MCKEIERRARELAKLIKDNPCPRYQPKIIDADQSQRDQPYKTSEIPGRDAGLLYHGILKARQENQLNARLREG